MKFHGIEMIIKVYYLKNQIKLRKVMFLLVDDDVSEGNGISA